MTDLLQSTTRSARVRQRHGQRTDAVAAVSAGRETVVSIARRYGVTRETVYAWRREAARAGGAPPPPRSPGPAPTRAHEHSLLRIELRAHLAGPGADASARTTAELQRWVADRVGRPYAVSTLRALLWRWGFRYGRALQAGQDGTWSYIEGPQEAPEPVPQPVVAEPTPWPVWMTPARWNRVMDYLRRSFADPLLNPELALLPILERMRSMRLEMAQHGATEVDLYALFQQRGARHDPVTGC